MSPEADHNDPDLRALISVISRRRWTIVLTVCVAVAVAFGVSTIQPKRYVAKARVLVRDQNDDVFNSLSTTPADAQRNVDTEIEVLKGEPIRASVTKTLGYRPPKASASGIGRTDLMEVRGSAEVPAKAATIANAYVDAYVALRREQAVGRLEAAATEIDNRVADLQRQVDDFGTRIAAVPSSEQATTGAALRSQRDVILQQQTALREKVVQLRVDASLEDGGARVVSPAVPPAKAASPQPKRNAALASGLGLFLGVGLAFFREHLDDSIKARSDLEAVTGNLPLLGLIPKVQDWRDRADAVVVSLAEPMSQAADAYRSVATSLRAGGVGDKVGALQITSPLAGEGKSSTVANLGVALALSGLRVLIVCADLHRPRLHEFFNVRMGPGLSALLSGEIPMARVSTVCERLKVDRLFLLPAGVARAAGLQELLSGARMREMLAVVHPHFDVVLIDSPPVVGVSDTAALARYVDTTVLVTSIGVSTKADVRRSLEILEGVDGEVFGVVLNNAPEVNRYGYYYRGAS